MNISKFFILRPVATTLLMLALFFSGLLVWRMLPVSALPQVDYPIIQIYTFQSGANPDTMMTFASKAFAKAEFSSEAKASRAFGNNPSTIMMSCFFAI